MLAKKYKILAVLGLAGLAMIAYVLLSVPTRYCEVEGTAFHNARERCYTEQGTLEGCDLSGLQAEFQRCGDAVTSKLSILIWVMFIGIFLALGAFIVALAMLLRDRIICWETVTVVLLGGLIYLISMHWFYLWWPNTAYLVLLGAIIILFAYYIEKTRRKPKK